MDNQSASNRYRLIDEADTINLTDEFLGDDAETWEMVGNGHRWMAGYKWATCNQPMRREISTTSIEA